MIDHQIIDAISHWVLQTGAWVGILLGLVLILRRPFAKHFGAQATFALWLIPVARLFTPNLSIPANWWPWPASSPDPAKAISSTNPAEIFPIATEITPPPELTPVGTSISLWLLLVWISGALIFASWQIARQYQFLRRLKTQASPIPASPAQNELSPIIQAAMRASGLKRRPQILLHKNDLGPCVTGLLRPIVILPSDMRKRFSDDHAFLALMHEFTHIKRLDLPIAFAALLFRALNWPNPLVHLASRPFRLDQEAACDAAVLSRLSRDGELSAQEYARTLLSAAQPRNATPLTLTVR